MAKAPAQNTEPNAESGSEQTESIEALREQVSGLEAALSQSKIDAETAKKAADSKASKLAKALEDARAQVKALTGKNKTLEAELKAAGASAGLEVGATHAVELVKPAPLGEIKLQVGAVIGAITPIKGATTDYVADAIRTRYARCVVIEQPAASGSDETDQNDTDAKETGKGGAS